MHGKSGMGKSVLSQTFIEELKVKRQAIVLTGRCYEQESVPFKALDSLIDSLVGELGKVRAADAGRATWRVTNPGQYAVYVKHVVPQSGTKNDQPYDEIREFATLAFDWPLDHSRVDADAVATFERAIATRAKWTDFKGFTTQAAAYIDGRRSEGVIAVKADGNVSFDDSKIEDTAAREWIRDQLHSIVIHRVPSSGIQSKPLLNFTDQDTAHPLGRLLTFHGGRFASTYRIRDDEITVVNRSLGKENMSLQMLETERNAEQQILSRAYQVQYRDAATGAITRVEFFQTRWHRIGKFDLPESLTQSISAAGGVSIRSLKLREFNLAK